MFNQQAAAPSYLDPYDLYTQHQPTTAGALGLTPEAMMPFLNMQSPGGGFPGVTDAGTGRVSGGNPDPNNPFAGGAHPTNPYTGATLGGGVGAEAPGGAGGGFPWGALAGGLGAMFGGRGRDPYGAARGQIGQIPGMLEKYFDPYIQAGNWALPRLEGQYGQLMQDPGAVMGRIGAGFQQSPGYEFQKQQATEAANQAAAAGGMVGSPQEQQQLAKTVTGLSNQDYYNYLNHAMNLYQQGLGGTSGLAQTGFGAASGLGEDLASVMEMQAQLAAAQQAQEGQSGSGMGAFFGQMAGAALPAIMAAA